MRAESDHLIQGPICVGRFFWLGYQLGASVLTWDGLSSVISRSTISERPLG